MILRRGAVAIFISIVMLHSSLINPEKNIPSRFDWREKNIMTPVKHQRNLGSCGVFAAVAVFESLIKKETEKTVDLSEQQIINGSRDFVPSGISSVDAMKYIKQFGLVLEKRLPYKDKKTDEMPAGPPDYTLTDYHYVQTDKLELCDKIKTIKQAVWEYGPVATNMIFYQDLDRYKEDIYIYDGQSEEKGGHWVVIVGWQDDSDVKNGGYWICRNSWGEKWGENGYFNIAYGECGIDDFWFVYGIFTKTSAPGLHADPSPAGQLMTKKNWRYHEIQSALFFERNNNSVHGLVCPFILLFFL